MSQDMWIYISNEIFKLKLNKNEVGSSTMPHKVNPIDFENAEGNFGISNSLNDYFINKLPRSRLQRDLSDSTVLRNIGMSFGYTKIGITSLQNGLQKISPNKEFILNELDNNFVEEPIVEFCTINSSGPKTATSLKIKVHLSEIAPENIVVDFSVTGSSDVEKFSYGEGILNIDAGLKSAIITIDDIPEDRYAFIQGDRKIIVTLSEASNALLGENTVYTHTLTDDQKAWTDPNANYFCISDL